jgi:hypothetical protein
MLVCHSLALDWNAVCVDVFVDHSPDAPAPNLQLSGNMVIDAVIEEKVDNVIIGGRYHTAQRAL